MQTPAHLAQQFRNHLKTDLLDFWLRNGIDTEFGGYLTSLDYYGRVYNHDKFSVTQTRMVYTFSEGFRVFQDERYHEAARQGFEFYTSHFWDPKFSGWYHAISRTGEFLWEPYKRTYDFAFVLYCFSEHYGATGDTRALEIIDRTIELLDNQLADPRDGGWFESFERKWDQRKVLGKTFNVCMHLLEANLSGYENISPERFQPRIFKLLDLIHEKCILPPENLPIELFNDTWQPTLRNGAPVINYGHITETAFFFLRLFELFGDEKLKTQALYFIDFAMKHGFSPETGMACFGTPSGEHDQRYYYWSQSETLAALARAFRLTGEKQYWEWLVQQSDIVFAKFVDRKNGEWVLRVDPDGRPGDLVKGASHKACYHLTQATSAVVRELAGIN